MKLTMMLPEAPYRLAYPSYPESATISVSDAVLSDVRHAQGDYYRRLGLWPESRLTMTPREAWDLFSQPAIQEACRYVLPVHTTAWPWAETLAAYLDVSVVIVEPEPTGARTRTTEE